jgi:hypothetical protein
LSIPRQWNAEKRGDWFREGRAAKRWMAGSSTLAARRFKP